jgi:glycolate oxidase FAD binding subunit
MRGASDFEVARLVDRIHAARSERCALDVRGGGTKSFYGESPQGEPLDLKYVAGISSYEPSELVITARAGTLLADLEAALAERGQCLPFEPPHFAPCGTVGGMVAAGLAGPARASVGGVRDYVLGVTLLNGRGELLTFGGQVMKNVAGYDVSRVMAGSWGVLGVLCEVSLKVLPIRPVSSTLCFDWDEERSVHRLAGWRATPLPINGTAWHYGRLYVRLAGAPAAVRAASRQLGGFELPLEEATAWWFSVRNHAHPFFRLTDADLAGGECLWRLSVPPAAAGLKLPGCQFIEWSGAQRWWRTRSQPQQMRDAAVRVGGHATLVRAAEKTQGAFTPVAEPLMRIHRALKNAFDPDRIFNRGRLYADL